jgi:hypothetical protein
VVVLIIHAATSVEQNLINQDEPKGGIKKYSTTNAAIAIDIAIESSNRNRHT